jgi:HPt (histidine-containing phosphotransfer) domain-containing protein
MQEKPNLTYIKELAGDDLAFEQKFINILKNEFPEETNIYNGHIQNNEPRAAAEIVHKLKHKFNILSMEGAYKFAVKYEEELRAGRIDMYSGFSKILNTIEDYLKTI